jgi:putative ABC transport system substrate-binding protein
VKTARVGVLGAATADTFAHNLDVFRKGLNDLGWVEGQNLILESRFLRERYDELAALAAGLVRLGVHVIFAMAAPAIQAAKRATTMIPIVIETLGDAVATGLVSNLARPGSNVTGVSGFAPELSGKRLQLLRELIPGLTRVALLANRANRATAPVLQTMETGAQHAGMQRLVVDIASAGGLAPAFDRITRARSEALILYEYRLFAELGGLLSYGPDSHERFLRAAAYVDRILRGTRPGDLPVEQPSTFELALNLATARRLGLAIPPALLLRANHLIE